MSYHVVRWVLARSDVAVVSERFVLVVLAEHAGHDGFDAYPSRKTIADETGLSERQVQRALGSLERAGAIEQTGSHATGVRIWRVIMDRDDFNAASWDAGAEANFYRRNGGDTASPRRPDVAGGETQRLPNHPNRPDDLLGSSESGDSDGWGDTASPPRRHSVSPRNRDGWQRAKTSLVDESRNAAAAAIYVEPLQLVGDGPGMVVLETSRAALERTRADWTAAVSDALYEATGERPNVHFVAVGENEIRFDFDPSSTPSAATRTLPPDEETPASTGRPDAGASSSLEAPPERGDP